MRAMRRLRPSSYVLVASGLLLGGAAAVAVASIPGHGGVIHACYAHSGGDLRVVGSGNCRPSETAIAWNQRGPRGRTGARGVGGSPGLPGRNGAAVSVRARSTGSVKTPADHSNVSINLNGARWTQAGNEVDLGPYGALTFTDPPTGSCGGVGLADLNLTLDLDGNGFLFKLMQASPDGKVRTAGFSGMNALFEPGAAKTHAVTATVSAVCESGDFPTVFKVSDLRFDMVRAS
jgi:hypothetical protein